MTCIEDNLEQWRICDQFSVVQAALLFLGLDPSIYETKITLTPHSENPEKFDAVFKAISDAVENGLLPAKWVSHDLSSFLVIGYMPDEKFIIETAKPDWFKTLIKVDDLKNWLTEKKKFPLFFFPVVPNGQHDLHDKNSKFYSAKLSAAVAAWAAVSKNKSLVAKKSVKQAIKQWIGDNNDVYGLAKEGIEQASTVANWEVIGGAPSSSSK